MPKCN